MISPVAKSLPIQDNTNKEETQTSMPRVRFKPTIPVFEWAKTCHALDRVATAIGYKHFPRMESYSIKDTVYRPMDEEYLKLH
jgi:hypothetical protein